MELSTCWVASTVSAVSEYDTTCPILYEDPVLVTTYTHTIYHIFFTRHLYQDYSYLLTIQNHQLHQDYQNGTILSLKDLCLITFFAIEGQVRWAIPRKGYRAVCHMYRYYCQS